MRTPHRSIETFDISLMAVVTKAMGAFLVLMLLLVPYYTPGGPGQVEILQQQLEEAQHKVDDLAKRVAEQPNAHDAAELQRQLAEHRALVQQLQGQLNKATDEATKFEEENSKLKSDLQDAEASIPLRAVMTGPIMACGDETIGVVPLLFDLDDDSLNFRGHDSESLPRPHGLAYLGPKGNASTTPPLTANSSLKEASPSWTIVMPQGWSDHVALVLRKLAIPGKYAREKSKHPYFALSPSPETCSVPIETAAFNADRSWRIGDVTAILPADDMYGVPFVFTFENGEVTLRDPSPQQKAAVDDAMSKLIVAQRELPELRDFFAQNPARIEQARKKIRDDEEARKKEVEDNRKHAFDYYRIEADLAEMRQQKELLEAKVARLEGQASAQPQAEQPSSQAEIEKLTKEMQSKAAAERDRLLDRLKQSSDATARVMAELQQLKAANLKLAQEKSASEQLAAEEKTRGSSDFTGIIQTIRGWLGFGSSDAGRAADHKAKG